MIIKNVLVTGGAGFIGSNFVRYILNNHSDLKVINVDKLTYAGNLANLDDIKDQYKDRYVFIKGDINNVDLINGIFKKHKIHSVVHFAAESHVDRSIIDSAPFVTTNVLGTHALLEASLRADVEKFVQVSTDEVYGSMSEGIDANELFPLSPSSPYSASKASGDMFALGYWKTFKLPVIITRSSNNYGPFQFPEKFIPLLISNALEDKMIPVYGDGTNVRDWIYVEDNCRAIAKVLEQGELGNIYNIGGENHWRNIDVAKLVLKILGKPEKLLTYVEDRKGHDFRYSLDCSRIRKEISWEPSIDFEAGIRKTIDWYQDNQLWIKGVKTKEYLNYYKKQYGL